MTITNKYYYNCEKQERKANISKIIKLRILIILNNDIFCLNIQAKDIIIKDN